MCSKYYPEADNAACSVQFASVSLKRQVTALPVTSTEPLGGPQPSHWQQAQQSVDDVDSQIEDSRCTDLSSESQTLRLHFIAVQKDVCANKLPESDAQHTNACSQDLNKAPLPAASEAQQGRRPKSSTAKSNLPLLSKPSDPLRRRRQV
eukprot:15573-Heterococcus_DN1.PRE.2